MNTQNQTLIQDLINTVNEESDCLSDLIDALREQRGVMRERNLESVKDLMTEISDIFFEAQTIENIRSDLAKKLAAKFSCEPKSSSLENFMTEIEKADFNGAVDRLSQLVFILKSEMLILTGMIDQNERFTSMLLSEIQRLSYSGDSAINPRTGLDNSLEFRG